MVESPVVYAAVVLLLAGVFPAVAARVPARLFEVLPPIVLSYAASTALAMAGCWRAAPGIDGVRTAILAHLLPALVFLMLVRCDLRAVAALGPRVLVCRTPRKKDSPVNGTSATMSRGISELMGGW